VEDNLKGLMQELGNAINESLSDSDGISGAIGEIRDAGYDVFLVLEATIGFNKRGTANQLTAGNGVLAAGGPGPHGPHGPMMIAGKVTWTAADQVFLKALNISEE
jgi:hypothetical protein